MSEEERGALSRLVSLPLEGLIIAYQRFISPALPPTCRYTPSCSAYALAAVRRFGPLVGAWLAVRRLGRCHPWAAGGIDPVPPRGAHGLPDWPAQRADIAAREAHWAGVRNDEDLTDPAPAGATDRCDREAPLTGRADETLS